MIKINERFEFEQKNLDWRLYEWSDGEDKDGNTTHTKRTTYHPNIEQIFNAVIDREFGAAQDLKEISEIISRVKEELKQSIVDAGVAR